VRTGRPKRPLTLTEDEQERLQSLAHRARSQPALARRAQVVLACAQGLANKTVAQQLRCSLGRVGKWRSRFLKTRLEGLYDEPRPGAPRKVTDAQVEQIVVQTLESTPRGQTHWSTRGLAQASGLSRMTVSRIWRAFGLQPHRTDTFQFSPDPLLIEKVRDIVGLYMTPPDHALVFCVDEKSQIQALDRTQPPRPSRPGQVERRTHDYKRHGTTSLFAALELKTSRVIGRLHHRHRSLEFRQFLDVIEAHVPGGLDVHIIVDNYGTHKNRHHPEMVRETPPLSCPLYAHLWFLDQPGGALVRRNHQQANSARRVPKRARAGSRHPPIHRRAQPKSQALRLDEDGGPNPGQHRSLRPAHVRRPTLLTYVTNHWDRRLGKDGSVGLTPSKVAGRGQPGVFRRPDGTMRYRTLISPFRPGARKTQPRPPARLPRMTGAVSALNSITPLVHDIEQGKPGYVSTHVLGKEFHPSPLDLGRPP
jgi:transposase